MPVVCSSAVSQFPPGLDSEQTEDAKYLFTLAVLHTVYFVVWQVPIGKNHKIICDLLITYCFKRSPFCLWSATEFFHNKVQRIRKTYIGDTEDAKALEPNLLALILSQTYRIYVQEKIFRRKVVGTKCKLIQVRSKP